MANNYILLERITVGAAGASSVTFANIPQTGYTDLKIVMSIRATDAQIYANPAITFNNDTTSGHYAGKTLQGNGASAYSANNPTMAAIYYIEGTGANATANTFGSCEMYIPNYTSSNQKSVSVDGVMETNATTAYSDINAWLWNQTSAINTIKISANGQSFVQYSTFSLYALAAVGTTPVVDPKALGGDIIQTDGTYWYHAFLSSGTFTPKTPISCDILQVAGGGGGGVRVAGGGGAGGVLAFTSQYLTASANTIQVGGGGTAVTSTGATGFAGNSGTNSQFASLTASVGGGGGGAYSGVNALTGGSGGGAGGYNSGASTNGASGTSGQGNSGGNGVNGAAGGGGGAGAAGTSATTFGVGGAGGAGLNTWSSWLSATSLGVSGYIAGGGGGSADTTAGAGGSGGGGAGTTGTATPATSGTVNTGSGGGGGRNSTDASGIVSGAGGSGLVIVRYLV